MPEIPEVNYDLHDPNFANIAKGTPGLKMLTDFHKQPDTLIAFCPECSFSAAIYSKHTEKNAKGPVGALANKLGRDKLKFVMTLTQIPTTLQLTPPGAHTPFDETITHEIFHYKDIKSGELLSRSAKLERLGKEATLRGHEDNFAPLFRNVEVVIDELGAIKAEKNYSIEQNRPTGNQPLSQRIIDSHDYTRAKVPLINSEIIDLKKIDPLLGAHICNFIFSSYDNSFMPDSLLSEIFDSCR